MLNYISRSKRFVVTNFLLLTFTALSISQNVYASDILVPQNIVDQHKNGYNNNENKIIQNDLNHIRALCFQDIKPSDAPHDYIATAGGPGASKSTILESYIQDKPNYAYIDPDQRGLRFMSMYYNKMTVLNLSKNLDQQKLLEKAYVECRGASNYIANTLLNEAFKEKFNIAHGTTSTSPQIDQLYKKLINGDYKITLLLCYSTDENRVNALAYRATRQNFVQSDPEDVVNKGKMFPERFEAYFQYADKILLYWTEKFQDGSKLAATLVKGHKIEINDAAAFASFTAQYDKDRQELKSKNLKSLQDFIDNFSK